MCPHLAARGAICGHVIPIFIRCKQTLYLLCASNLILVFAILVIEISLSASDERNFENHLRLGIKLMVSHIKGKTSRRGVQNSEADKTTMDR